MTSYDTQDSSFPYPLVGGLVGTIVSLAGVWIIGALFYNSTIALCGRLNSADQR